MQKRVLVTGGSIGTGRQTALTFAKHGAHVVINYKQAEDDAKETLAMVQKIGGTGYIVQGDVSIEEDAVAMVKKASELLGGLDVLVNNAGITIFKPFPDLDSVKTEDWDILYKTNVESVFFCSRAAAKIMNSQENGGCIINLSSLSGMGPVGSSIPYSVSKAGVIHLSNILAQVLAPKIRVNCVSPCGIENTRWNATNPNFDPEKMKAGAQDSIPLKRNALPQDVANAIYFLASEEAVFITGVNLPVDGGTNIKKR